MKRVHSYLLLFLCSLTALYGEPGASKVAGLTADQLVRKHIDAMGGWRSWQSIESIRQRGTLQRGDLEAEFVVVRKRPKQMRMTVTLPPQSEQSEALQVIRGCDGESAWSALRVAGEMTEQCTPLDEASAQAVIEDASFLPMILRLHQQSATFELLETTVNAQGARHYVLAARPRSEQPEYRLYLSADTYLLERYEVHSEGTAVLSVEQYNFQKSGELLLATETILHDEVNGETRMRIESTEIGVGIYDEYFLPAVAAETRAITSAP